MVSMKKHLIELYEEIANITKGKCLAARPKCKSVNGCCDIEYCKIARDNTLRQGVNVKETNHPTLLYMSRMGCIMPPHLRPLCSVEDCVMSGRFGWDSEDNEYSELYWKLKKNISDIEFESRTIKP